MFTRHDKSGDGANTLADLFELVHGSQSAMDPFGASISH